MYGKFKSSTLSTVVRCCLQLTSIHNTKISGESRCTKRMYMHDIRCFIDFRGYCVNDEMHCYVIAHLTMYMPVFNDFNILTSAKNSFKYIYNQISYFTIE